jgi:hypothetical protein
VRKVRTTKNPTQIPQLDRARDLERAHQLEQQALGMARMTQDSRAQRLWQDVAQEWRARIESLKSAMETQASATAALPKLLQDLAETEAQIRSIVTRIQRQPVPADSGGAPGLADVARLSQLQEELAGQSKRRLHLRAEIHRTAVHSRTG